MSIHVPTRASTEAEIRNQLREITEPHEKSCQALGDVTLPNHNDGEFIHKPFAVPPLHKYLHQADNRDAAVAKFPQAFVDPILHTNDRDLELLDALAGEIEYDHTTPHPTHESLERYPRLRAKMMEWVAADERRVRAIRAEGGRDFFIHGEPGGGKTTLALSLAMWSQQVNNETFIWAESVDESGTNERTQWLTFAPYATVAVPSGMGERVRIVPEDTTVPSFEVSIDEIARDVIRYDSVQDLMRQLVPGQFYVVYPDPLHRGCREVSKFNYWSYEDVTPPGEPGPDSSTDADQWWFAFTAHRISGDVFPHPTFVNLDEAGNILDADAEKDEHEHYQKIRWFRDKYADARKKDLSFAYQTHSLSELHRFARQKIRWRVTMNGNEPPINRTLPGERSCPIDFDITSSLPAGEAVIWKSPNFAKIKWPNLKRQARLDAQVSIDFCNWQEAMGVGA